MFVIGIVSNKKIAKQSALIQSRTRERPNGSLNLPKIIFNQSNLSVSKCAPAIKENIMDILSHAHNYANLNCIFVVRTQGDFLQRIVYRLSRPKEKVFFCYFCKQSRWFSKG